MSNDVGTGVSVQKCLPWCCCCCIVIGAVALLAGVLTASSLRCFPVTALAVVNVNTSVGLDGGALTMTCAAEYVSLGVPAGDGMVEVYRLNFANVTYASSQTLTPPNASEAGMFGAAVSADCRSGVLAVGEPTYDSSRGRAHVYNRSSDITDVASNYALLATLENPEAADASLFGRALSFACQRRVLAVGAPMYAGGDGRVYVYAFDADANDFVLTDTLDAPSPANVTAASQFGSDVALSCDALVLVVGAPKDADDGSALVYDRPNTTEPFVLTSRHDASEAGQTTSYFGASVATAKRGAVIVIGAPRHDSANETLEDGGLVRVLSRANATAPYMLLSPDLDGAVEGARFGASVSVSGDGRYLVVGSSSPSEPGSLSRFVFNNAQPYAYNPDTSALADYNGSALLGAAVATSFAGKEYGSVSASNGANSTQIGVLACSNRQGTACPAC